MWWWWWRWRQWEQQQVLEGEWKRCFPSLTILLGQLSSTCEPRSTDFFPTVYLTVFNMVCVSTFSTNGKLYLQSFPNTFWSWNFIFQETSINISDNTGYLWNLFGKIQSTDSKNSTCCVIFNNFYPFAIKKSMTVIADLICIWNCVYFQLVKY